MKADDAKTELISPRQFSSDEGGLQGTQLRLACVSFLCDRIIMLQKCHLGEPKHCTLTSHCPFSTEGGKKNELKFMLCRCLYISSSVLIVNG